MSKLPCYKCITFPICLTKVNDEYMYLNLQALLNKCTLIRRYVCSSPMSRINMSNKFIFEKYFRSKINKNIQLKVIRDHRGILTNTPIPQNIIKKPKNTS